MPFPRPLRKLVRRGFAALGLEFRRVAPASSPAEADPGSELARVLARMVRLGARPATVFDVGVAHGTPDLYAAFPDALHVLVEPLAEFTPAIDQIARRYRVERVAAAAGAGPGHRTIHVHRDPLGSSLLREAEGPAVDGVPREIAVTTLDRVASERGLRSPYLVKIDVQGAELEVLAGAITVLASTEAVLLEASLYRFFHGGPVLDEVVAWMRAQGFVAWDLWGRLERPLDGALAQVDLAFVRADGALWRDHRFATPEQREG